MNRALSNYLPGILLFLGALMVGFAVCNDYGVSWDEMEQREMGMTSYAYVFEGGKALDTYSCRHYGVGIELPLVMLEKFIDPQHNKDVLHMRHMATHIFFLLGALSAYVLVFRLFRNRFLGCV